MCMDVTWMKLFWQNYSLVESSWREDLQRLFEHQLSPSGGWRKLLLFHLEDKDFLFLLLLIHLFIISFFQSDGAVYYSRSTLRQAQCLRYCHLNELNFHFKNFKNAIQIYCWQRRVKKMIILREKGWKKKWSCWDLNLDPRGFLVV